MSKRFDIKLALEEVNLEVDKVTEATLEDKNAPESKQLLDDVVKASEEPVEVPEDTTTLDGSEPPAETNDTPTPEVDPLPEENQETNEETKEPEVEEKEVKDPVEEKPEETPEPATEPVSEEKETPPEATDETTTEETKEEKPAVEELEEETSSLVEVSEIVKENEENTEQVNTAFDAIVTLEEIAEQLENSLETGGMSPATAVVTDIVTRDIYSKVGIDEEDVKTVSVENFNSASTRVHKTNVAIESIMDKIDTIIKAIISSIARGIEWVKNFIKGVLNNLDKYKLDIKNLKEALSKTPDVTIPSSTTFKNISTINALKAGPINVRAAFPLNEIDYLTTFTKSFFENVNRENEVVVTNMQNLVTACLASGDVGPDIVTFNLKEPRNMILGKIPGYTSEDENLESFISTEVLPGDITVVAFLPKDSIRDEDWNEALRNSSIKLAFTQQGIEAVKDVPILSKQNITNLLSKLEALCDEGLTAKKIFEQFSKDKTSLKTDLDKLNKEKENKDSKDKDKEYIKAIFARYQMLENMYVNGSVKLSELLVTTIKAGISFSTECIKVHNETPATS